MEETKLMIEALHLHDGPAHLYWNTDSDICIATVVRAKRREERRMKAFVRAINIRNGHIPEKA